MPDAERRSLTLNYNKALPSYHTSVPNRHGGGQRNPNKALIVCETLGVGIAKRVPEEAYPCTGWEDGRRSGSWRLLPRRGWVVRAQKRSAAMRRNRRSGPFVRSPRKRRCFSILSSV